VAEATGDAQGFRYERKFVSTELDGRAIETLIRMHPAIFREIHRERFVNNVYFDTHSLENYQANVSGNSERVKCRIRWYGEMLGFIRRPILELKRKRALLGKKDSHPLPGFSLGPDFRAAEIFESAKLSDTLSLYLATLRPTLLNRYRRRYFLSADSRYRITVDSGLEFHRIDSVLRGYRVRPARDPRSIVELKFNRGEEEEAWRITKHIPFRLSKSSKYVSGIEALLDW
jgi:hypothetical protein